VNVLFVIGKLGYLKKSYNMIGIYYIPKFQAHYNETYKIIWEIKQDIKKVSDFCLAPK
jgi:hypothetical protein